MSFFFRNELKKERTLVVREVYGGWGWGNITHSYALCIQHHFFPSKHTFSSSPFSIFLYFFTINIFFCSWKTFSFSLLLLFCFLISTFFPCVFPPFTQNTQSKNSRRDRWDGERGLVGFGNSFVLCLVECEKMENNKKM